MLVTFQISDRRIRPVQISAEQSVRDGNRLAFAEGHLSVQHHLAGASSPAGGAELALKRWKDSGVESLCDALSGEFALVLADGARWLLLSDPMGMVQLYWGIRRQADGASLLAAGTNCADVASALAAVGGPCTPNKHYLAAFVADYHEAIWDTDQTPLAEVRCVPRGHYTELDLTTGAATLQRYWFPERGQIDVSVERSLELLNGAMEQAMSECFAHGPIAVSLSGGADSSMVMAYAARIAPDRTHCLTMGLPQYPHTQEVEWARKNARGAGLDLNIVDCSSALPYRPLQPDSMYRFGLPINIFVEQEHLMADKARSLGARVVVDGVGGDDLFGIGQSPASGLELLAKCRVGEALRSGWGWCRKHGVSPLGALRHAAGDRRWNPLCIPPYISAAQSAGLTAADPARDVRLGLKSRIRAETHNIFTSENAWNRDAVYSPRGMKILHPLLAREVVELTYALPQVLVQDQREYKWLQKELLRKEFPFLKFRPLNGDYSAFIEEGMREQKDRMQGYFEDDCRLVRTGIATPAVIDFAKGYLRDPRTSEEDLSGRGYLGRNALCAEMWLRGWEDSSKCTA